MLSRIPDSQPLCSVLVSWLLLSAVHIYDLDGSYEAVTREFVRAGLVR